ncbi:hypothetical protein VI06_15610 [Aquitalea magnusonii]|nr:hypothetical protein VI06_15610 [Aquitalea magnusonii]
MLVVLIIFPCATFGGGLKRDVTDFIKNAEMCEHFAGEWDAGLSSLHKQRIEFEIHKYCKKAKIKRNVLLVKYKNNKKVIDIIDSYDSIKYFQDG